MFNNTKETYEKALESNGFTEKLTYIQPNEQNQNNRETKKKRKRKSIRFNPFLFECQNQCWKVIL